MASTFDATDLANPCHYDPSQTALLLLDFHNLFVNRVAGANAGSAMKAAAKLRQWAKKTGVIVIHGLVDFKTPCIPIAKQHARMASISAAMTSSDDEKEPAELLETDDEEDLHFTRVLGKISALSSPGILEALSERGVKSLLLCGLSTSGCVLRTSTDACEKGFVTTVISDGCADPDQEVHRVVTEKIIPMTAFVCVSDDFISGYALRK